VRSLVWRSVPETQEGHAEFVALVGRVRDLLNSALQRGVRVVAEARTLDSLGADLADLDSAFRALTSVLLREGLPNEKMPDVKGLELRECLDVYKGKQRSILEEKEQLKTENDDLVRRLVVMGVTTEPTATSVSDLRAAVSANKGILVRRHRELQDTLGPEVVLLIESASNGRVPSSDMLDDKKLGEAIRKAVGAGFQIKMEAPNEDQR